MKRLVLNIITNSKNNPVFPMLFKGVRKYYWNTKIFKTEYNLTLEKCVENELVRTFRFFPDRMQGENETKQDLLIESVKQGNLKMIEYLISHGMDIQEEYRDFMMSCGAIALWKAARTDNLKVAKYLVEKGAEVLIFNFYPCESMTMVEYLTENGGSCRLGGEKYYPTGRKNYRGWIFLDSENKI